VAKTAAFVGPVSEDKAPPALQPYLSKGCLLDSEFVCESVS
jgi:hypothetical protein